MRYAYVPESLVSGKPGVLHPFLLLVRDWTIELKGVLVSVLFAFPCVLFIVVRSGVVSFMISNFGNLFCIWFRYKIRFILVLYSCALKFNLWKALKIMLAAVIMKISIILFGTNKVLAFTSLSKQHEKEQSMAMLL